MTTPLIDTASEAAVAAKPTTAPVADLIDVSEASDPRALPDTNTPEQDDSGLYASFGKLSQENPGLGAKPLTPEPADVEDSSNLAPPPYQSEVEEKAHSGTARPAERCKTEGAEPSLPTAASTTAAIYQLTSWSFSHFKNARQYVMEKLGKADRTEDPELEARVEKLFEQKRRYTELNATCEALLSGVISALNNQQLLSKQFEELAIKEPELRTQFERNSATQAAVAKHGSNLVTAMKFFVSNVATLCDKAMEDTMTSFRAYEQARIEYDAVRGEIQSLPADKPPTPQQLEDLEKKKDKMATLRDAVMVKMDLLNENRLKVMRKQLLILNNATCAYFSGDEAALKAAVAEIGTGYDLPSAE